MMFTDMFSQLSKFDSTGVRRERWSEQQMFTTVGSRVERWSMHMLLVLLGICGQCDIVHAKTLILHPSEMDHLP
jgi:hypothetical protein